MRASLACPVKAYRLPVVLRVDLLDEDHLALLDRLGLVAITLGETGVFVLVDLIQVFGAGDLAGLAGDVHNYMPPT